MSLPVHKPTDPAKKSLQSASKAVVENSTGKVSKEHSSKYSSSAAVGDKEKSNASMPPRPASLTHSPTTASVADSVNDALGSNADSMMGSDICKNEYFTTVYKRLRNFRKRLQKIERYEVYQSSAPLNEEQLALVKKKSEAATMVQEMESILQNFETIHSATTQTSELNGNVNNVERKESQKVSSTDDEKDSDECFKLNALNVCHWLCRIDFIPFESNSSIKKASFYLRERILGEESTLPNSNQLSQSANEFVSKIIQSSKESISTDFDCTFADIQKAIYSHYFDSDLNNSSERNECKESILSTIESPLREKLKLEENVTISKPQHSSQKPESSIRNEHSSQKTESSKRNEHSSQKTEFSYKTEHSSQKTESSFQKSEHSFQKNESSTDAIQKESPLKSKSKPSILASNQPEEQLKLKNQNSKKQKQPSPIVKVKDFVPTQRKHSFSSTESLSASFPPKIQLNAKSNQSLVK